MKKIYLVLLFFILFVSCEDTPVNVGDNSDIKKQLVDNYRIFIYRDAFSFDFKIDMTTVDKFPADHFYVINNSILIDKQDISIEMIELRGYKNNNWDGHSQQQATALLNLSQLFEGTYNLQIDHPQQGSFKADMILNDEMLVFNVSDDPGFIELRHDTLRFMPVNYFWGYIEFDKNIEHSFEEFNQSVLNAGAKQTTLPKGFYSYFEIDEEGNFINNIIESDSTIKYSYYFRFDSINELEKIKNIAAEYKNKSVQILNITGAGEFFPEE